MSNFTDTLLESIPEPPLTTLLETDCALFLKDLGMILKDYLCFLADMKFWPYLNVYDFSEGLTNIIKGKVDLSYVAVNFIDPISLKLCYLYPKKTLSFIS